MTGPRWRPHGSFFIYLFIFFVYELAHNDVRSFPSFDWMVRAKLSQASFATKTPPKDLSDRLDFFFLLTMDDGVGETDLES